MVSYNSASRTTRDSWRGPLSHPTPTRRCPAATPPSLSGSLRPEFPVPLCSAASPQTTATHAPETERSRLAGREDLQPPTRLGSHLQLKAPPSLESGTKRGARGPPAGSRDLAWAGRALLIAAPRNPLLRTWRQPSPCLLLSSELQSRTPPSTRRPASVHRFPLLHSVLSLASYCWPTQSSRLCSSDRLSLHLSPLLTTNMSALALKQRPRPARSPGSGPGSAPRWGPPCSGHTGLWRARRGQAVPCSAVHTLTLARGVLLGALRCSSPYCPTAGRSLSLVLRTPVPSPRGLAGKAPSRPATIAFSKFSARHSPPRGVFLRLFLHAAPAACRTLGDHQRNQQTL